MQIYTEVYNIRFSKEQKATLKKLAERNIRVPDFIRQAVKEKLQREYKDLIVKPKKVEVPF
jgi:predicted transcriptional regulator